MQKRKNHANLSTVNEEECEVPTLTNINKNGHFRRVFGLPSI